MGSPKTLRKKRSSSRGSRDLQRPDTGAPTCPPRLDQSDVDTVPSPGRPVRRAVRQEVTPLLRSHLARQGPSSPALQAPSAGASMAWQVHNPPFLICFFPVFEISFLIARLSSCRWIVPAHGEVQLKVHFSSTELGQFEQTLHFEILGTKRLYQLPCRGTCLYPAISQDPR